jgi:hypothetical protein
MTRNKLVEKGARPLNKNRELVRTLADYLLKVAKDERFTSGKVKKVTSVLRKLFEEQGVPFEHWCTKAVFPNATDVELSMLGMRDVCKLAAQSGPLYYFRETIFPMIIVGEWDFRLNTDEVEAILKVLELKIEDGKNLIDLKTNEPLKTQSEKMKELYDKPENKARVKKRQRVYDAQPAVKERKRVYNAQYKAQPAVKERQRVYNAQYKAQPEVKEKKRVYNAQYNAQPEVKERKRVNRKRRKLEHIIRQLKFPPPLGFNAPCATCPREKSLGWMRAIKAHKLLSKKFDEKGLKGYLPLEKSYNILNIKKRAAKGEGCPKLNQNDVFCLGCWTTTQVEADNKIAKVLAERNKNEQLMK